MLIASAQPERSAKRTPSNGFNGTASMPPASSPHGKDMNRAVDTLAKIELFRSLTPEEIKLLDSRCIWRRAKAREWILDYQEESTEVFFLTSGIVRVLIQTEEGRETILRDIQAGASFGELAAIDQHKRSASILALTDATIARMSASTYVETVTSHPQVAKQALITMTRHIRSLTDRVREFTTLGIHDRLTRELVRMSRPDRTGERRAIITPPPTHAHLAGLIGTRRETVTKELRAMAKAGLLETRRGAIVLLDVQRLVQNLQGAK
jgi:CRP/FNR family transcriptional regulator, cyclic AMP receptor protein